MLARFGAVARRTPFSSASRLLLSHQNFVRCFARDRDGDGAYENEAGFDADGFGDEVPASEREGPNATQPDGPATDSDADAPHIFRLMKEARLPQHNSDEILDDQEEIREELAFRKKRLEELDQIISEDWVLNHENGVYYNPKTGETKVPFEKSFEEYKMRRAGRQRKRTIEEINNHIPDYISPVPVFEQSQFYPEIEMRGIRDKYKHLNFKELQGVLNKADQQFFQKPAMWSMMKWGVRFPFPGDDSDIALQHELEHMRFMALLPYRYHVATMRVGHMTKLGRKMGVGVLLVGGTGNGYVGYGYGKASSPAEAMKIATHNLRSNMMEVPLDEGRTIPFSVVGKFRRTKVIMQRCTRGRGIRAGPLMQAIFECAGLEDMSAKITGSRLRNPMSIIQAIFQGLGQLVSPRALAASRGVNYYEEYCGPIREPAPTPEELAKRTSKIKEYIKDAEEQWARRTDLNHRDMEPMGDWTGEGYVEEPAQPATEDSPEGEKKTRRPRMKDVHMSYYPWNLPKSARPTRPTPRPGWAQGPELKRAL